MSHLVVVRLNVGRCDVAFNGVGEDYAIMHDRAALAAPPFHGQSREVDATDHDLAFLRMEEAEQELDECGLARA